jgi:putative transposase
LTTLVGGGRNAGDLESAVAEYIDWFNHRRLHGEIGLVLPAEQEASFYRHHDAGLPSPRQFRGSTEPGTG